MQEVITTRYGYSIKLPLSFSHKHIVKALETLFNDK